MIRMTTNGRAGACSSHMRMSFQSSLRVAIPAALLVAALASRLTSQGAAATAAVDFAAGRSVNSASGVLYERHHAAGQGSGVDRAASAALVAR